MSKGNVFKLSGNMALGGTNDYGSVDIDDIKNSLKLLKAKKNQRQSGLDTPGNYAYPSGQPKNGYQKPEYNYDGMGKNHLPSSQKETGYNYGSYGNEIPQMKGYGSKRQADPYDYSNKPPSYPQQNNNRNKMSQQYTETYDNYQGYSDKKAGKSSTIQTRATEQNSYNYPREEPPRQPVRQPVRQYQDPQPPRQQRQPPPRQQPKQQHQAPQMQYYNQKEQRSIKQINRENRVEIVEYDPSELRTCDTCGRKFNPNSIAKHKKICNKVFVQKRKEFNAQDQRIVDNNQKKFMKKGEVIEKKIEAQQKNQKIPKWKADSMAFRAGMKQNRNEQLDSKEMAMLQQAESESTVKCPYCGRKFNETAGSKHVKFCQEQQKKKNMMKKR